VTTNHLHAKSVLMVLVGLIGPRNAILIVEFAPRNLRCQGRTIVSRSLSKPVVCAFAPRFLMTSLAFHHGRDSIGALLGLPGVRKLRKWPIWHSGVLRPCSGSQQFFGLILTPVVLFVALRQPAAGSKRFCRQNTGHCAAFSAEVRRCGLPHENAMKSKLFETICFCRLGPYCSLLSGIAQLPAPALMRSPMVRCAGSL